MSSTETLQNSYKNCKFPQLLKISSFSIVHTLLFPDKMKTRFYAEIVEIYSCLFLKKIL